jgi:nucleotide-binding universal stress UspA family protein
MLTRILVPLDGSPLAESVLPQVVELANLRKAEVVLVRVALAHTLPGRDPADAQVRAVESAQRYLAKIEADLAGQGIAARSVVRYGHAAEEILDHVRTGGIDLIAMSTHGRSGLRRWVLGSVAETVTRRAPVPVMLLHARGYAATPAKDRTHEPQVPAPPVDAATPGRIRHILCPVDLSPLDREVLQSAGTMAQRFEADLTVLHSVYDAWDVACSHIPHPPLEQLREQMIRLAEDTLRREVRRTLRGAPRTAVVVVVGPPFEQINRFARSHAVDLIVMGTKGLTGLDHFLMGSTAEQVVRTAPCPVLSIRAAA